MNNLELNRIKIDNRFECLESLVGPDNPALASLRATYDDCVSSILARYLHGDEYDVCYAHFTQYVVSESIIEQQDDILQQYLHNDNQIDDINELRSSLGVQLADRDVIIRQFESNMVQFPITKRPINICDECGHSMSVRPDTSELYCEAPACGRVVTLYGIVFEDSQFYNQQTVSVKNKKYDPNSHLSKWIDKILAKEAYEFSPEVISRIDAIAVAEYTNNGMLRPMNNLKCERVRSWLQKLRFTDCYDHAPLLRKIITGMHGKPITPPDLTPAERKQIIEESALSLRSFEIVIKRPEVLARLGKDKINNKFYYPYILWQMFNLYIADPVKRRKLLECIHLQSETTLRRNDIVWKEICELRKYPYNSTL